MRMTLHPGLDVLLEPGARLGDLRADLARLARRPELLVSPLAVDGVLVHDDHLVGTRPLLPGATLRALPPGTGPAASAVAQDPEAEALRAPWHVAVLSGPGTGGLHAVHEGSTIVPAASGAGGASVVVTLEARRGAAFPWTRRTGRRPRVRAAVRVSVRGARGTWESPGVRPRRVRGRRPQAWPPGRVLLVGDAVHDLRPRPRLEEWAVTSALPLPAPAPAVGPGLSGQSIAMALTPAVGSLALAATLRQPVLALLALLGPLMLVVPLLVAARRRRSPGQDGSGPAAGQAGRPVPGVGTGSRRSPGGGADDGRPIAPRTSTDPVGTPSLAGAHRGTGAGRDMGPDRIPGPATEAADGGPPVPSPADLMTAVIAVHRAAPDPSRAQGAAPATSLGPAPGTGTPPGPPRAPGARLPDGCVAVVGQRADRLAAARTLLLAQVASGATVEAVHADEDAHEWAWLRWLPRASRRRDTSPGAPTTDRALLVDDSPARPDGRRDGAQALDRWWAARGPHDRLILLTPDKIAVPAWCRTVLDATHGRWHLADGSDGPAPWFGVTAGWAERYARHLAATARLGRWPVGAGTPTAGEPSDPAASGLPVTVSLAALLGLTADEAAAPVADVSRSLATHVALRWEASALNASTTPGLPVALGLDASGRPVLVDVVRDGPHALVAGTTGAGKSELLQSLVLGLALTTSPRDLAIALVDYKGGASFGGCVGLPHVVGQVTDLEPGLAGRALAGLRAELRRREHVVAGAGATCLEDLPPGALPRLLVVVDEFRALADDLPDFLPGLLRLASQGRSLGVHLVLATQRPAGAVTADMRANISLRVALRQVDAGDSHDVIDAPHAARIPVDRPGRAVLRRGDGPPLAFQCAHAASPAPRGTDTVRPAPRWGAAPLPVRAPEPDAPDLVTVLVAAAREAAATAAHTPHPAPWLPGLPRRVTPSDLPGARTSPGGASERLPLALSDLPAEQRRGVVTWDVGEGHLAVVGRPRSGRTTALRALAVAALDRGWDVHVVAEDPALTGPALREHAGCGTVVDQHDPRRVARLVDLLLARAGRRPTLVLLDGSEDLRASLGLLAGGTGADLLGRLLGDGAARGVHVVLSGQTAGLGGLAHRVGPRLVLTSSAVHDDVAHGVPSRLAGRGGRAGRGVWLGADEPVECQVVIDASPLERDASSDAPSLDDGRSLPLRLAPLPRLVLPADLPVPGEDSLRAVPVGIGGDAAVPQCLDVTAGGLVVGPGGSGRSSALLLVLGYALPTGRVRAVLSRDPRLTELVTTDAGAGGLVVASTFSPYEAATALNLLATTPPAPGDLVVVDDLDVLQQACPLEVEVLTGLVRTGVVLLASASTVAAATAHRGPLAEVRAARCGIVLRPGERGSGDVFGMSLERVLDPGAGPAGRAVLVRSGALVPVQVASAG
ncbi:ESX-1 secretion system protein EccCa1 [Oerskovia enterophila]|uniref:ESX-1 secretion system protein EccCa1 n=2 Tax=Oerskovia enterophila TaxID=43678 RepID=A0ABX2Y8F1_9CELL|nr:ESX-1 secretion system protein EccCa1 [Oerskovia enterophila]